MASLYEINRQLDELIANAVDPETGELKIDENLLNELELSRAEKIKNIGWAIKNAQSDADQLKAESDKLAARSKVSKNLADRLKSYLDSQLGGEKFRSDDGTVNISYRSSKKVELAPNFMVWAATARPDLIRQKEPEADKVAIAKALKDGDKLDGAYFVDNQTIIIK